MTLPKIKLNRENLALVGILVILVAIPLTVILLGVRQELRKRAAPATGSILINNGAETTTSRNVTLTLTAPTSRQALLKIPRAYAAVPRSEVFPETPTDYGFGDHPALTPGMPDPFWQNTTYKQTYEFYVKVCRGGLLNPNFTIELYPAPIVPPAYRDYIDNTYVDVRNITFNPRSFSLGQGECVENGLWVKIPIHDSDINPWASSDKAGYLVLRACQAAIGGSSCEDQGIILGELPEITPTPTAPPTPTPTPTPTPSQPPPPPPDPTSTPTPTPSPISTPTPTSTPVPPTPTPTPVPVVEMMMVSNFGDFSDGVEEPFAATKSWALTEGDGEKTVWAKFKWSDGTWTTPVFDTITLQTVGPTPTPTVTPTLTPTPTIGPSPTPTPTPSPTPTSTPTPTPTPPPSGYLKLDLLKVWFKQQDKSLGRGHEGALLLALKQGGNVTLEKEVKLDANGEARDVELPGVTAGTYNTFIYEPGYLTKKLSNVLIGESGNTLDFTKASTEYFLVGDFNGDQEVNILDFSIFVKSYGKSGEE